MLAKSKVMFVLLSLQHAATTQPHPDLNVPLFIVLSRPFPCLKKHVCISLRYKNHSTGEGQGMKYLIRDHPIIITVKSLVNIKFKL